MQCRKEDREIVLAAVMRNGVALQYTLRELQKAREIVLAAPKQNGAALQHVLPSVRDIAAADIAVLRCPPRARAAWAQALHGAPMSGC